MFQFALPIPLIFMGSVFWYRKPMSGLKVKNNIFIDFNELRFSTAKSSGPGGQHVNTTNSKVILHWNIESSESLTQEQKDRVVIQLGSLISKNGQLIITSDQHRSQVKNKQVAIEKFVEVLNRGLTVPKKRTQTRVPKSQKTKRLDNKKARSNVKAQRKSVKNWD